MPANVSDSTRVPSRYILAPTGRRTRFSGAGQTGGLSSFGSIFGLTAFIRACETPRLPICPCFRSSDAASLNLVDDVVGHLKTTHGLEVRIRSDLCLCLCLRLCQRPRLWLCLCWCLCWCLCLCREFRRGKGKCDHAHHPVQIGAKR